MKRWSNIMSSLRSIHFSDFFTIFILIFILSLAVFCFTLEAAIPQKNISINNKTGKVSVFLKDVQLKDVFEDIGEKTGIEFLGLDEITGTIDELEFKDLPLEEAIRTLGQDTILIFRKEGPEGEGMKIKKVIFLAQKEEEKEEPTAPLPSPPSKRIPPPPERPTPPPTPPSPPTFTRPSPPPPPAPEPPPAKPVTKPVPPPSIQKPEPPPPPPPKKPAPAPVKPAPVPRPKTKDANLEKGLKYFKEKRWDLTIKYLNIYLKNYPEDKEIQNKLKEAKENTDKAIALYKSGKSAERSGNFAEAYRLYKNSYDLYPLLYDTWERMKAMQRKL